MTCTKQWIADPFFYCPIVDRNMQTAIAKIELLTHAQCLRITGIYTLFSNLAGWSRQRGKTKKICQDLPRKDKWTLLSFLLLVYLAAKATTSKCSDIATFGIFSSFCSQPLQTRIPAAAAATPYPKEETPIFLSSGTAVSLGLWWRHIAIQEICKVNETNIFFSSCWYPTFSFF